MKRPKSTSAGAGLSVSWEADLWGRIRAGRRAALADLDRALALGHDEPMLHYQVGRLCVRLESCAEQGEEALRHYLQNSEGRNRAFGHYRLAQLLEQTDRLEEAKDEAESALELEPDMEAVMALHERMGTKIQEKKDLSR